MPPKKRVILYNPAAVFHDMPLALAAIGSALDPHRFEVVIVAARVDDDAHRDVLDLAQGALCLGVTALTGRTFRDAQALIRQVKAACPSLPVVWGGWHPSPFAKEVLHGEPTVDVTRQFDYISSVGCHFRRAFCAEPEVFGRAAAFAEELLRREIKITWVLPKQQLS